jgi:hypothetical protein
MVMAPSRSRRRTPTVSGRAARRSSVNDVKNMTHGLSIMKRAFRVLGTRAIDGRTTVGKALRRWKAALIADLGGPTALSAAQLALVELVVRDKFIIDRLDVWLLTRPSLVDPRRGSVIPAVREHHRLVNTLVRQLRTLGLERRKKPGPSFYEFVTAKYGPDAIQRVGMDRTSRDAGTR